MDYQKHYDSLIGRARNRAILGYCERHHIVPRCMGGGDEDTNLVDLTPEEHYVAHQLLVKLHPDNYRVAFAALAMTMGNEKARRNNKLYGWLRRRLPEALDTEHKAAQSRARKGRKLSDAHRAALRRAADARIDRNAAKIRAQYGKYIPRF